MFIPLFFYSIRELKYLPPRIPSDALETYALHLQGLPTYISAEELQEYFSHYGEVSTPFTLHHTPYTIYHTPYTIYHTPYTIYHTPYTIHHAPYTIYHTPYTIYHIPYT
ncbi:RNA-binding protein, partial [archaeon]